MSVSMHELADRMRSIPKHRGSTLQVMFDDVGLVLAATLIEHADPRGATPDGLTRTKIV